MGLPSGVQWASCNVGAVKPSDLGLYFSWGNIDGHGLDDGYDFSQNVYDSTPAASINANLSLDQDAARANLGDPWRMPTKEECQELYDNCTHELATLNGVDGILFTSNVNGNTLFFPAAGYYGGESLIGRRTSGYIWSSSYYSTTHAFCLAFSGSDIYPQRNLVRRYGFSVRAVMVSP